jgi:hypothetical protein
LASAFKASAGIRPERCNDRKNNPTWCVRLPGAHIEDKSPFAVGPKGEHDNTFDLKGDVVVELPSWGEIASARQGTASALLAPLIRLRAAIIQRIAEMEVSGALTPRQRQAVYASLVMNASQDPASNPGTQAAGQVH